MLKIILRVQRDSTRLSRNDVRADDIKKKSQIEIEMKLVEIETRISALTKSSQKGEDVEDPYYGRN